VRGAKPSPLALAPPSERLRPEGASLHPAQGNALGIGAVPIHARANGPTVHRQNGRPVGPKRPTLAGSSPQGGALGWVNRGPSARIGNKAAEHTPRRFSLHTLDS
jgi:hypothetical protein